LTVVDKLTSAVDGCWLWISELTLAIDGTTGLSELNLN